MVQADSNDIKKWKFCWLHPPGENYFVSSWHIKKIAPTPPRDNYFVSWWLIKKIAPTPPRDNYFVSSWQISNERKLSSPHHEKITLSRGDIEKKCPHPTTRKLFCLVVTNLKYTKYCCKPLQITPCRIGLPWPYVEGFSAQLYDGMYKCHQLTYNALSDPHSHYFQWFPRLDAPMTNNLHQSDRTRIWYHPTRRKILDSFSYHKPITQFLKIALC